MLVPIVAVSLPASVPAEYAAALLSACDRSFSDGECQLLAAAPPPEQEHLEAVVTWLSATEARVIVRRSTERSGEEELVPFEPQDDMTERYRALGFTVGSLAASFLPEEPPLDVLPTEPEAAPNETAVDVPEPLVVPTPTEFERDEEPEPAPLPSLAPRFSPANYLEVSTVAGSGLDGFRWGGGIGIWITAYDRWATELSASYSHESSSDPKFEAGFVTAELTVGPRFQTGTTTFAISGGGQVVQLIPSIPGYNASIERPALGGVVAGSVRFIEGTLAPFVSVRGSWTDTITVRTDETFVSSRKGPQWDARLGLSLRVGP